MGIFDSLDSDEKAKPRPPHWLDGFKVQLPVDKDGKLSGKAVGDWHPADNYKPWYVERAKTLWFKNPEKGAVTSPGRKPRCELSQIKTWAKGKLSMTATMRSRPEGGDNTIMQVRDHGGTAEPVQVRVGPDAITVRLNDHAERFRNIPYAVDKPMMIECEIDGKEISVTIDGEKYAAPQAEKWDKNLFKVGAYGVPAHVKIDDLKWS